LWWQLRYGVIDAHYYAARVHRHDERQLAQPTSQWIGLAESQLSNTLAEQGCQPRSWRLAIARDEDDI